MTKEFVVVTGMEDRKINTIVIRAFEENNGKVALDELARRLLEGIKFNPLKVYGEDDPRLKSYRECDAYVYELKDGIVYRFPPITYH
jgi:hypothetical protein